jgi:hypothetical protein
MAPASNPNEFNELTELDDLSLGSLQHLADRADRDLQQQVRQRPARPTMPAEAPAETVDTQLVAEMLDLLQQHRDVQRSLLREIEGLRRAHHDSYALLASAIGHLDKRLQGNQWLWKQAVPIAIAASLVTLVVERLIALLIS